MNNVNDFRCERSFTNQSPSESASLKAVSPSRSTVWLVDFGIAAATDASGVHGGSHHRNLAPYVHYRRIASNSYFLL